MDGPQQAATAWHDMAPESVLRAVQMRRQIQFFQEARNFVQVQVSNVLLPAILNDLADVPFALEWIGEIKPVGGIVQTICLGGEIKVILCLN